MKKKYLHRKERKSEYKGWSDNNVDKNIDLFSDLPMRQSNKKHQYGSYDPTPLREFLFSKIGKNMNDIYSEIIKKIDPKFRHEIDRTLEWLIKKPIYDDDFIPRDSYGRVVSDYFFIDMNNILVRKSKDELLFDAKKYKRKIKLEQLLENQEKENQENQNS